MPALWRAPAPTARICTGIDAFAAALAVLKPDRIAGAGGLRSRDDAMLAGETGADYVMFGEPGRVDDRNGRRAPFEEIVERLTWWAELFEMPCVGYAAGLDEIEPLARTGADFIALGDWIWTHPQGAAAAVAAAQNLARRRSADEARGDARARARSGDAVAAGRDRAINSNPSPSLSPSRPPSRRQKPVASRQARRPREFRLRPAARASPTSPSALFSAAISSPHSSLRPNTSTTKATPNR